ncbi:proline--tRNA ligase [Aliidongia dinghuensis]|uniref:Proline--tRNA ligase n=1 Tax=Aliidongia dinghuensis TaxID=1867774 RepID=A0A8J2YP58_9PROT|nr:proline--tRNA ligase [Aliidongia dinghuensis]GGF02991.1 proline--tRNA ligase [Aliidongia dinghuensis]
MKNALRVRRSENFADWYQEVIREADMAENSGVRGCMVIKPWGWAIWEGFQAKLDRLIKETGHDNCYFPIFIPVELFEKEASHVEGFAKEMAVVTHHRLVNKNGKLVPDGELESPLVVRPTSETIIGEAMARWIKSYRDLPLKINQWANVVRWEMRTRIFLRTSEFLWQEGHTAHATREEAIEETRQMLDVYRQVVEGSMRIPVIAGEKSPGERFPGADETHTIEAMMQDGRALQAGTSHFLGQNFAKAANIQYQDRDGGLSYAYTTSWGASTRLIGALIMTHSDDDGLRLPPKMAPAHVVIVPILRDEAGRDEVILAAEALAKRLRAQRYDDEPVRVKVDLRDDSGANKRWAWIKKGVPLVVEIGPRDVAAGTVAFVRRDAIGTKRSASLDEFVAKIGDELNELDQKLHDDALAYRKANMVEGLANYADLVEHFEKKGGTGFVVGKYSGDPMIDAKLGEIGLTIRCLPHEQSGSEGQCLVTGAPATVDAIYAKAY